ncbi:MAG: aminotransferase class V-fold PLP-dependent enzyme [Chthoniobacteraceae bacterium]
MTSHTKLFIPGPVEVSAKTFAAFCTPMIGHRSGDFKKLYASVHPRLQNSFRYQTAGLHFHLLRLGCNGRRDPQYGGEKVLNCMNGAFSDKWFDVSKRCGKQAEALQVEWGQPIDPAAVDAKLATGEFDAVTLIHNETSTGVMSPLKEICDVIKKYPDVVLIVDTVSSFSAVPIAMDELGVDVLLTGSQKALALPPGMALFSVSEKAFKRAETIKDRGYYFDFIEFKKNQEQDMTPSTPVISHIYALRSKLDDMFEEGLEQRFARHAKLNSSGPRLGGEARVRVLRSGRLPLQITHLREEQQEHRRAGVDRQVEGEIPLRDRRRLRQDQGRDLPHLQHGRRDRRDHYPAPRLARRLPRGVEVVLR